MVPHDAIVVVGQGEAYGKPDIANLQLGVEARAPDPKTAIAAANERMAQLIEALKAVGVKPEDMQTRDFNIHSEQIDPRHGYTEPMGFRREAPDAPVAQEMMQPMVAEAAPARAPKVAGAAPAPAPTPPVAPPVPQRPGPVLVYRVSNMLHITVRQIDTVGDVLSRAVEAGANQAWGVSFDIDDPEPLASKSRAEAIEDARKQAGELAKLAGVKLGRVVSVMDEEGGGVVAPAAASRRFDKAELSRVPVEGGQLAVQRRVRIVFAIEPPAAD